MKPATLGSSVGITKAHDAGELDASMAEAFRFARKVVVEQGFEGVREIECAVLGNDDPVASICGEIVPTGHEFYDYASKYLDAEGARLDVPADVDPAVQARVQRMAVTAFRAVECWGMARVDFFLRGDELFVNEINTIPGFTEISMYPKLWGASGLGYGDLIERLIDLAVERHDASVRCGRRRPSSSRRRPDRSGVGALEVHDRAGQRARDALDRLDAGHDQLPQFVDGLRLGAHDHVVGAGDVLGFGDTGDRAHALGDRRCLAHLGLDQDVRVNHVAPSARWEADASRGRCTRRNAHPCGVQSIEIVAALVFAGLACARSCIGSHSATRAREPPISRSTPLS